MLENDLTNIEMLIMKCIWDTPEELAPAYGIAGWTADGNNVLIYDAYDWWKIDLTGERQPECITKGYGRKNQRSIRKMTSNIDKEVFNPDETIIVSVWDENTMDEGIYSLDMKGRLKKLAEGPYIYSIHRFSDNQKYCIWNRQNVSEFRDLWWSKSDFSDPIRITNANPQQSEYKWGTAKLVEWTNYENPAKITNPGNKTIYRIYGKEDGKIRGDLICLVGEHYDESDDLTIFDPQATWKKSTLAGGTYTMRELLVPIFIKGQCVYKSPSVMDIRSYCKDELNTLWDESRRLVNPQEVYVDLSMPLYKLKNELLDANHKK